MKSCIAMNIRFNTPVIMTRAPVHRHLRRHVSQYMWARPIMGQESVANPEYIFAVSIGFACNQENCLMALTRTLETLWQTLFILPRTCCRQQWPIERSKPRTDSASKSNLSADAEKGGRCHLACCQRNAKPVAWTFIRIAHFRFCFTSLLFFAIPVAVQGVIISCCIVGSQTKSVGKVTVNARELKMRKS